VTNSFFKKEKKISKKIAVPRGFKKIKKILMYIGKKMFKS